MNPDSACVLFTVWVTLSLKNVLKQAKTILLLDLTKCII